MNRKLYWGVAALIILIISVAAVLLMRDTNPATQEVKIVGLKPPPPRETYATGHWNGNTWHRTAPPEPEEISVDGEMLNYEELKKKINRGRRAAYPYNLRVIEEYPYSEAALAARYKLARSDENFESVWDEVILLSKYKEMLKYHSDSPRLLHDLAQLTWRDSPDEAITYGKEALKYHGLYPTDSSYGLWTYPEETHQILGQAYQEVGDYKSALVHLKTAQKLIAPKRSEGVSLTLDDISSPVEGATETKTLNEWGYQNITHNIKAIEAGRPLWGPPSEVVVPDSQLQLDDLDIVDGKVILPDLQVPDDFSGDALFRTNVDDELDPWNIPSSQEFKDFLRWIETIENAKSPADLDDFLMHEIAKQLQGEKTEFSSERLIRAYETFQQHGDTEGIKQLKNTDPELERAVSQHNKPARSKKNK